MPKTKKPKRELVLHPGEEAALLDGSLIGISRLVHPQPDVDAFYDYKNAPPPSYMWRGGQRLLDASYGADYIHSGREAVERAMIKVCPFAAIGDVVHLSSGEAFTITLVTVDALQEMPASWGYSWSTTSITGEGPWVYVIDLERRVQ